MRLSVITPTCDRPFAFGLLERWMARQTRQPDEWIVADGGRFRVKCHHGQTHLVATAAPGPANFANNLLRAVDAATGDFIVCMEDDDYYQPTHLVTLERQLSQPGIRMAGDDLQRYYNVAHRKWRIFNNKGASLCQTGFNVSEIPVFRSIVKKCLQQRTYGIDGAFWAAQPQAIKSLERHDTVLGIKGLPGQVGLGIGHRPANGWTSDPAGKQLEAWIGKADADTYTKRLVIA